MYSYYIWLPLLAENNLFYGLVIAAILVITLTLFLRLYRYQSRQKRVRSTSRHDGPVTTNSRSYQAEAPDSLVRWEVQMHDLARDLKAEIDSKMIALGHLVRDADRAAERLEKALASAPPLNDPSAEEKQPAQPRAPENAALREEVYTLADYGFSVHDIASRMGTPVGQVELILRLRGEKS